MNRSLKYALGTPIFKKKKKKTVLGPHYLFNIVQSFLKITPPFSQTTKLRGILYAFLTLVPHLSIKSYVFYP